MGGVKIQGQILGPTWYRLLFVCYITKSFLTYSFLPPTPALSTISRPLSSSMCSITPETANVCSSYNRMRGPGIGCWFSDRSNCSHWSFEAAVLPINPNNYCRTRCRQSQLRFVLSPLLLHPRLLETFQSDNPLFTYQFTSLSFHFKRTTHPWDLTISNVGLESQMSLSKSYIDMVKQHCIDSYLVCSTPIGQHVPEIQLLKNLTLKGQCQGHGQGQR